MGSRIDNLGDYNKVRIDLQNCDGKLDLLYKKIGDTEVAKAAPKIFLKGSIFASTVILGCAGCIYVLKKYVDFAKDRQHKIKNEEQLKKEFAKELKNNINE